VKTRNENEEMWSAVFGSGSYWTRIQLGKCIQFRLKYRKLKSAYRKK
jgi:hypothetical protein